MAKVAQKATITAGGQTYAVDIPATADDENNASVSKGEAQAAIDAFQKDHSNVDLHGGTVTVGAQSQGLDQYLPAAATSEGGTTFGSGPSHGFALGGTVSGGLGELGHNTRGLGMSYVLGVPLSELLFLDGIFGAEVSHSELDFNSPGGEKVNSAFTSYGATIGADLRIVPNVADKRIGFAVGPRVGVSSFSSDPGTPVSLPASCTPGNNGRSECGPVAGPRTGNSGLTGLVNPDQGGSRGPVNGMALITKLVATASVDAARGTWGSFGFYGQFGPAYTALFPSDGHSFSFWSMGAGAGVIGRFGGSAAVSDSGPAQPRDDGNPVSYAGPAFPANRDLTLGDDAAIAKLAGLQSSPENPVIIRAVKLDNLNLSGPPYTIPASAMTQGDHTLYVQYRYKHDSDNTPDRIRVITKFKVGDVTPTPITQTETRTDSYIIRSSGEKVSRPPLVGGQKAEDIPILSLEPLRNSQLPENSVAVIRVSGPNSGPMSDPVTIPLRRDGATSLTVPRATADGAHTVEITIKTPGAQPAEKTFTQTINVLPDTPPAPPVPTLSGTPTVPPHSSYYSGQAGCGHVDPVVPIRGIGADSDGQVQVIVDGNDAGKFDVTQGDENSVQIPIGKWASGDAHEIVLIPLSKDGKPAVDKDKKIIGKKTYPNVTAKILCAGAGGGGGGGGGGQTTQKRGGVGG
jgi:hypothetical protein